MQVSKQFLIIFTKILDFILPFLSLFFLAALFATNSVSSTGILVIFAFILWFEPELGKRWWKVIWPWLLVIFIYFVLMSFHAFSQITALRDGVEVIKGIALSLVALHLRQISETQLRRVMEYVVIFLSTITIGIIFYNLYQHSIMSFINNIDNKGFDWYLNRNRLAVGFSVTSVFITALMVVESSRWKSTVWSILWTISIVAGLLNGSRGALMGMVVAVVSIILAAIPRLGWRQVFRLELWAVPTSIVIAIVSWIFYQQISLIKYFIHDDKSIDTGRFDIWKTVLGRVVESPWFGYGPHAMKFDPTLSIVAFRNAFDINHPHSIYVGLVYASGFVGVLFWLIWFFSFSRNVSRNFTTKNELSYYIGIGLLINILVHGIVDFDFYMYSVFAYIIVGLVMLLPSNSRQGLKI